MGGALHCPCLVMDSGYEKLVSDSFMLKEELKYELVVQLMGTLPVGANNYTENYTASYCYYKLSDCLLCFGYVVAIL